MSARPRVERAALTTVGATLALFLALPLVALFVTSSLGDVAVGLRHPLVGPALRLSLFTTSVSLVVVVTLGTPLAWALSRSRGGLARAVETALQLPVVVPPAVAGVALLFAFGRRGLLAPLLGGLGGSLSFTTAAVVVAEVFVSAPFYVQAATSAFRRVDPRLVLVAQTLGASPLRVLSSVALPLAAPGLAAGAAMSWARALGEFGATLMFAGNLEGRTQTLPLAIYTALEADLRAAQALSIVLVLVALALLVGARLSLSRAEARAEPPDGSAPRASGRGS